MTKQSQHSPLTPQVILSAYQHGFFPMGMENSSRVQWFRPDPRAVIPLERFHVPRSLSRFMKKKTYEVRINGCFEAVMRHCMKRSEGTWITDEMIGAYTRVHRMGFAHSLEIYCEGRLTGGLYGISMGGAFCGESMFHLVSNHSKIALCELVHRMKRRKMILLDAQFPNDHLKQFNLEMIPDAVYYRKLQIALTLSTRFA